MGTSLDTITIDRPPRAESEITVQATGALEALISVYAAHSAQYMTVSFTLSPARARHVAARLLECAAECEKGAGDAR